MSIVTSTIKGQIVIPAVIRAKFKIKKGTQVNVYDDGNKIIVEPVAEDSIEKGRGMLKTRGKILRALIDDRKKEAAALSRKLKAVVVTGDPEFKKLGDKYSIQWLKTKSS
jgi:AbrB family looped-hinge helix DNA binding protein